MKGEGNTADQTCALCIAWTRVRRHSAAKANQNVNFVASSAGETVKKPQSRSW